MPSTFPYRPLLIILFLALIGRILLLASGAVSFHSDEAIVGLMARHINAGARPTFFYGQSYMGSLDSWLVAFAFRIFGESVLSIRIVQSALYMLTVAVNYAVAWRMSRRVTTAVVTGLLFAIPAPLLAVYSTASLGGYGEIMLLGGLILGLGHWAIQTDTQPTRPAVSRQLFLWAALGFCAGVGWWVNGLIAVYLLPLGVVGLYALLQKIRARQNLVPYLTGIGLALVMFILGSSPWWAYDLNTGGAASSFYLGSTGNSDSSSVVTPAEKLLGFFLFGLPALIGMRFPWSTGYFLVPLGLIVLLIYVAALYRLIRAGTLQPLARPLLLSMLAIFVLVFTFSSFGTDSTGRYLLPLLLPLAIALGALVDSVGNSQDQNVGTRALHSLRSRALSLQIQRIVQFTLIMLPLTYNAAGQIYAARTPPGITTQFTYESHIPNDHDAELIAFLDEHKLYHGYTHYWVVFRLAFLSGERMQYSPALPYHADLRRNPNDNRYPPYTEATENAERIAYITTDRLPDYDPILRAEFEEQGITYQEQVIGPYRVYYNFEPTMPQPRD
jgi:4-amino-4-deoxy-L-arabinose transferase-like glycosyltransferase